MAIEMKCTGCAQTLRVADEHAGKQARCPECGTIVRVPGKDEPAQVEQPSGPALSGGSPFADDFEDVPNPFADQATTPYRASQAFPRSAASAGYQTPHRGGTVLTFGILGLMCCFLFGISAWVMGASDLKEMQRGTMDRSGQGLTQAGMILGVIGTILGILGAGIQVIAVLAGLGA